MSLLLLFNGRSATVDCTVSSSQGQNAAIVADRTIGSAITSGQAQSVSGTLERWLGSIITSWQAQSFEGVFSLAGASINCTIASSQAQGVNCVFTLTRDCAVQSAQAQSSYGLARLEYVFTLLQTLAATTDIPVTCYVGNNSAPYLLDMYQDMKTGNETFEQFITKAIKAAAHKSWIDKQTSIFDETIFWTRENARNERATFINS